MQFLEEGHHCNMPATLGDYWLIQSGYANFMINGISKAAEYFQNAEKSQNIFIKQASKYFLGKILLMQDKKEEANAYWKELAESPEESKYRELAKQQLKK